MAKVDLRGVHKVTAKGRDYYYAWRGGPRVKDEHGNCPVPGTPMFLKALQAIVGDFKTPETDRFRTLVVLYRGSNEYKALAASTKSNWSPWLDKIEAHFGTLRIAQFDRTEKIRPVIRRWRGKWANQPRTADYAMQVLSRVCSHGVDPLGKLASNPCEGIKRLYKGDRSDIIWTDADITQLKSATSKEVSWAVDLAAHTGLRLGDLVKLPWTRVGEHSIEMPTSKGKKQNRVAIIPIYDELRKVLGVIPKRATTVLTNTRGKPWTTNGFGTSFDDAKIAAKMKDRDLHFHDLRGTAATKFYLAGIEIRVIAEVLAWDEESVEKIIRRYVNRAAATKALIAQMDAAGRSQTDSTYEPAAVDYTTYPAQGVYFILSGDLVKIGWSFNVAARLKGLQTGSSKPLKVVYVAPALQEDEAKFHRRFAAHRAHGEWFRIEGPLYEFLAPHLRTK
jgi:integrase